MKPIYDQDGIILFHGDCVDVLPTMPAGSVHCCVTSPPYYGLRDYGHDGQIGLEDTPDEYVARLVDVFRDVRRVLRDDGTLWLNLGDSYASTGGHTKQGETSQRKGRSNVDAQHAVNGSVPPGFRPKDLIGIPWRVAFALQADGWHLRSDIIWHKPNPMPESVTDRPTKAHEYVFLLSKSERYFYDADAVREPAAGTNHHDLTGGRYDPPGQPEHTGSRENDEREIDGRRNRRSVWTVAAKPYKGAHFATFPPDLIEPCILAGCPPQCCPKCGKPWKRATVKVSSPPQTERRRKLAESAVGRSTKSGGTRKSTLGAGSGGDAPSTVRAAADWQPNCPCLLEPVPGTVLDPFAGAATTGIVAIRHRRRFKGIEINPDYISLSTPRLGHAAIMAAAMP